MDIDMVPDGPKNIPPYISRNQSSLGELLLGFLRYYATVFRYQCRSGEYGFVLIFSLPFLHLFLLIFFFPHGSSICPHLPASFFGFMFLAEGQQQVGPLALRSTNMTYMIPVFVERAEPSL